MILNLNSGCLPVEFSEEEALNDGTFAAIEAMVVMFVLELKRKILLNFFKHKPFQLGPLERKLNETR